MVSLALLVEPPLILPS